MLETNRFTGAIGPDHGDGLALFQREGHIPENLHIVQRH